jgi:ABC-2 type transport system permease protein
MKSIDNFTSMVWVEFLKAARSKLPLFTTIGFMLIPLVALFFMVILRDPEYARRAGLISDKAQMMAGSADWPTFLGLISQAVAVGGLLLFSLIVSWLFGREFVDGTLKDLLAVPIGRANILFAKFFVALLWSFTLALTIFCTSLLLGWMIDLPLGNVQTLLHGTRVYVVTALLVICTVTPIAFFASLGRGYLLPIGATFLFVLFANVLTVAGYGSYFPWSIPSIYAGAGDGTVTIEPASIWIVLFTALTGITLTYLWWNFADQNK